MSIRTASELLQQVRDKDHWLHGEFPDVVLAARVEKVLALHHLMGREGKQFCAAPSCAEDWPCSTVRLLNGEEP